MIGLWASILTRELALRVLPALSSLIFFSLRYSLYPSGSIKLYSLRVLFFYPNRVRSQVLGRNTRFVDFALSPHSFVCCKTTRSEWIRQCFNVVYDCCTRTLHECVYEGMPMPNLW